MAQATAPIGRELVGAGVGGGTPQGLSGANAAAYNVDPQLMGVQNELYSMYSQGQLMPAQQQAINLAAGQAKQGVAQSMANMGLTNSTMEAELNGNIDMQAATQQASMLNQNLQLGMQAEGMNMQSLGQQLQWRQNMISQGLSAYGVSASAFGSAANIGLDQQQMMLNAISTAMSSAGEVAGGMMMA